MENPYYLITTFLAVLGTVLGIFNACLAFNKGRIRIAVDPNFIIIPSGHPYSNYNYGVGVINKSDFPITIADVGFYLKNDKRRITIGPAAILSNGKALPFRLEARESVSFFIKKEALYEHIPLKSAYVRTSCDRVFKGKNKSLKSVNNYNR